MDRGASPGAARRAVERVFDALDLRPVERWIDDRAPLAGLTVEAGETEELEESFHDTDDWRLWRAGLCLTVRRVGNRIDAALRSVEPAGASEGAPADRHEALQADADGVLDSRGDLFGGRLRALRGPRSLSRRFELRLVARALVLTSPEGGRCAVSLERITVPFAGSDRPARLCRVKLCGADDDASLTAFLDDLVQACALRPTTLSRFQSAAAALGLTPPDTPELGPERVERSQSVAEAAFAVLRRQFRRMLREEPGTRLGEDIEALHDMRVATRRMRAALRLFREHLPARVLTLNGELRWLGRALGEVRDLDVQLATLASWQEQLDPADRPSLDALHELWSRERVAARRRMLRALDSRRYERLLERMAAMLRQGPPRTVRRGRAPVPVAAPPLIQGRYRRVVKLGRRVDKDSAASVYHRLRIRCKALRYALEFHADLYGPPARRMIRSLVELQDLLGEHQDADVAVAWLRDLPSSKGPRLPAGTLFVAGKLAERFERRARRLRRRFPASFERITGKSWRRLDDALRRAAGDAEQSPRTARTPARPGEERRSAPATPPSRSETG